MTIRSAIYEVLDDDATLGALLTGGVYDAGELTRQDTPSAFDSNKEILPCALMQVESEVPFGPFDTSSREFVVIRFYQRRGYATIDAALARVFDLLNRQRVEDEGVWEIRHVDDVRDTWDQALDCAMSLSRYQVVWER
jgi:hypothetical protein